MNNSGRRRSASLSSTSPNRVGVGAGAVDLAGAVASGVSAWSPRPEIAATLSGGLWAAGAVGSEASQGAPRSWGQSAANFFSGAAGGFSAAAPWTQTTELGYASAGSWGLSGIGNAVLGWRSLQEARKKGQSMLSSGLQIMSGVANTAAAGLSAASVYYASHDDESSQATSRWLATGSSAAWAVGSLTSIGSAWFAPRSDPGPILPVHVQDVDGPPPDSRTPLLSASTSSYSARPRAPSDPPRSPSPASFRPLDGDGTGARASRSRSRSPSSSPSPHTGAVVPTAPSTFRDMTVPQASAPQPLQPVQVPKRPRSMSFPIQARSTTRGRSSSFNGP